MKWNMQTPKKGDIIRVAIGDIYHYGIYVSDDEVIQFGMPPRNIKMMTATDVVVLTTNIDVFLGGGFLEVGSMSFTEKLKAKKSDAIVDYARSRIGTGGYNILYNNCEHFVNECVFGVKKCDQVEDVRAKVLKDLKGKV